MAYLQPAGASFGAILRNPTLRNLLAIVVGGTSVNLWIATNAPVPGYGDLLGGGNEATFEIPDEVPAHKPGPNVPTSSIFGFPDTVVYSQANLPRIPAGPPSSPLTATVGGANVPGALAPQTTILLGLLFGFAAVAALFLEHSRRSFKQKLATETMLLAWTQAKYNNAVQEKDKALGREMQLELEKAAVSIAHLRALQGKDAEAEKAKADFLLQPAAANSRPEVCAAFTQTDAVEMVNSGTQTSGTQTSFGTQSSSGTQTSFGKQISSGTQTSFGAQTSLGTQTDSVEQRPEEQTELVEENPPVERIQVNKRHIRAFLLEKFRERTNLPALATDTLITLPLPCFDPLFADLPIPKPISATPSNTTSESPATIECVDCHRSYTKQGMHHHFGICREFFDSGAVYCLATKQCYFDNTAFRSQHKSFCSIEGCGEKVDRPEKKSAVPGAPTGPKGLMGSKYASSPAPSFASGSGLSRL